MAITSNNKKSNVQMSHTEVQNWRGKKVLFMSLICVGYLCLLNTPVKTCVGYLCLLNAHQSKLC